MSNPNSKSDTGWSVAQSKRSKRQGKKPVPVIQSEDGLPSPNPHPELSVSDLRKINLQFKAMWLVHPNHDRYVKLATDLCAAYPHTITTAVCLGLGSADCVRRGVSARKPVFTQLEMFHTIIGVLPFAFGRGKQTERAQGNGPQIRCYFQDPLFTPAEVAYLESLGHTVLKHPQAFDQINKSTFLYAPHLGWAPYVRALCAPNGPPAVVVGNDLGKLDAPEETAKDMPDPAEKFVKDIAELFEEYGEQLKKLRQTHRQARPLPNWDYVLNGMMYWRDGEWDNRDEGGDERG